ncbi:hypothetical protein SAMD00019534_020060 [Acytostelium subglobosum LB1]|uniref:hypothetical protein n=1 Tax=Acytostelium subglobosum LB1 TaxID=1410327 RepID=UPI000644BC3B|nr:hypothetical protein SAMD00019534_020060 [Acytostelium subglobosum LB1]GAM18831.1 hypothetical protein SAMD00019534_020060 [Acytostelium subglobosum LB1]|eukprot:XP_012758051.1 hypothetical protein SAMD00019534_020060 [Acytostelium subglobosum LB1]
MIPNNSFIIRDATIDDVQSIRDIYCHYVREETCTVELAEPSLEEFTSRFNHIVVNERNPYYVATTTIKTPGDSDSSQTETTVIAGYAYIHLFNSRSGYKYTCEDTIYLNPAFKGCGLGALMLKRLITVATKMGYRQMIGCTSTNNEQSGRLHTKHGFQYLHKINNIALKFGQWIGVEYYQLALGEGDSNLPTSPIIPYDPTSNYI